MFFNKDWGSPKMASSRIPLECDVLVPPAIMDLARIRSEIHVNPPPEQRVGSPIAPTATNILEQLLNWPLLDSAMRSFLKSLRFPQPVVLHFRGYRRETGTAIINLESIYWTGEGDCRLDFEHPRKMKRLYGCPNFWSAFILAMMPTAVARNFCMEDRDGSEFVKLCEVHTEIIPTHLL